MKRWTTILLGGVFVVGLVSAVLLVPRTSKTPPSPEAVPEPVHLPAVPVAPDTPADPSLPDVVIFFADDAGFKDFGFMGSDQIATPHIDALAEASVRFRSGYVAAPVCSPSRAALLTGRYPQRFGHEGNPPISDETAGIPVGVRLLPELLAPVGYQSAVIGKWHLGAAPPFHPNARGFDHFSGFLRGERTYLPTTKGGTLRWQVNGRYIREPFTYVTDFIAEEAVRFVEHAREPYVLFVAFSAVHAPLEAKQEDIDAQSQNLPKKRRVLAAMTTAMDRAVGRVLEVVDDDALVFFINDNGAGRKNHGRNLPLRGGKGRVFEGGVRVPFVARLPGIEPRDYDGLTSAIDVVPTVLAAAGVDIPDDIDGVDLRPHLDGTVADPPHDALYWRMGQTWAVRSHQHKLVHDRDAGTLLFDIAADPNEKRPLHDANLQKALRKRYADWNHHNVAPAFESATQQRKRQNH